MTLTLTLVLLCLLAGCIFAKRLGAAFADRLVQRLNERVEFPATWFGRLEALIRGFGASQDFDLRRFERQLAECGQASARAENVAHHAYNHALAARQDAEV